MATKVEPSVAELEQIFTEESYSRIIHNCCESCIELGIIHHGICGTKLLGVMPSPGDTQCEKCTILVKMLHAGTLRMKCPDGGHALPYDDK